MAVNNMNALINQQSGFSVWKNLDTSLKRLMCTKENSFTHLIPQREEDDLYRDTPIFTCKFASKLNNEHLVALANEDGKLAIHDCKSNSRFGSQAHNNAIFDLSWMFDQMQLVTASGDHTSKLYDIGDGDLRQTRVFCGHTRSVKTVAFRKEDSSVFATGGRDGNIILWDIRTDTGSFIGKADRTIPNSHLSKATTPSKPRKRFGTPTNSGVKSVTGLVFQEDNTLISCGAGDGLIKIWDLRKHYGNFKKEAMPKNTIPYPGNTTKNGYSSLLIDSGGIRLFANCLDNTIYCYNIGTYETEPVMRYIGHQNSTFYVKSALCKDGEYLISGSSDENAYIWNTKFTNPLVKLTGHTAEVTCVAWCNKSNSLITCSDDMTHMIWTIGPEDLPRNWEISLRGRVEVVPKFQQSLVLKRTLLDTGEDTPKKFFLECEKCSNPTTAQCCENCFIGTKRKNIDDLNNENKIVRTEFGPRRLFANIVCGQQCEKSDFLANVLDQPKPVEESETRRKERQVEDTPSLRPNNHENRLSELGDKSDESDPEPQRKLAKLEISPKRDKNSRLLSPTVNLPNYIVDGIAPHLHYSPPKKKCQDWLTKMRTEKFLRQEMLERTIGESPKQARVDGTPKSKRYAPKSPLLRYFKVTNSMQKNDGANCSKYHNCSGFSPLGLSQNDN